MQLQEPDPLKTPFGDEICPNRRKCDCLVVSYLLELVNFSTVEKLPSAVLWFLISCAFSTIRIVCLIRTSLYVPCNVSFVQGNLTVGKSLCLSTVLWFRIFLLVECKYVMIELPDERPQKLRRAASCLLLDGRVIARDLHASHSVCPVSSSTTVGTKLNKLHVFKLLSFWTKFWECRSQSHTVMLQQHEQFFSHSFN